MPISEIIFCIFLLVITIYTIRGCVFCWLAFPEGDAAGQWISIAETMVSVCWIIVGMSIILTNYLHLEKDIMSGIILFAFLIKAVSCIMKSEKGYQVIYNTYRKLK